MFRNRMVVFNGYLPDTYGMAANDLGQLMTSWRNSAMNATK